MSINSLQGRRTARDTKFLDRFFSFRFGFSFTKLTVIFLVCFLFALCFFNLRSVVIKAF